MRSNLFQSLLGESGLLLIGVTVLGAIFTGILGNCVAASRLLYSMAEDRMLPRWFGRLNDNGVPRNAVLFIMALSCLIPFFGRTAVAWIVDVTTIALPLFTVILVTRRTFAQKEKTV